ncbi:hypothetical protein G6F56_006779 [Rhizopus delemar]|nr:hypothetical protein G6F56_006779 [Rhizopus delemar]
MEESISESRASIPTSFQGSWNNIFVKVDGTRAVDWLDFLLHAVPTDVAPFIQRQDARDALLGLVPACNLSLQWQITNQMLREMSAKFRAWLRFLKQEAFNKNVSYAVFRSVQHYLCHIPLIIHQTGPLRVYSTRSMKKAIGNISKSIHSNIDSGKNASNINEQVAMRKFIKMNIDIEDELNLIKPKQYRPESFWSNPSGNSDSEQLWEFFKLNIQTKDNTVGQLDIQPLQQSLNKFYRHIGLNSSTELLVNVMDLAGRAWIDNTVYNSKLYRHYRR